MPGEDPNNQLQVFFGKNILFVSWLLQAGNFQFLARPRNWRKKDAHKNLLG
jgi:hypothetical protein